MSKEGSIAPAAAPDEVLTAADFIAKEEALVKEASEVLPQVFDKCTHSKGYIRQRVYSCKECTIDGEPAGMCYSCFVSCHTTHQVEELFVRRNFRCDCGTGKMKGSCSLQRKYEKNEHNKYDHNFAGSYCWCKSPYDDGEEDSEMFQCLVCEDWYHDRCLKTLPEENSFEDFICRDCVSKHSLWRYPSGPWFMLVAPPAEPLPLSYSPSSESTTPRKRDRLDGLDDGSTVYSTAETPTKRPRRVDPLCATPTTAAMLTPGTVYTPSGSALTTPAETPIPAPPQTCPFTDEDVAIPPEVLDMYCFGEWRKALCRCKKCLARYEADGITFILEEEVEYEPEKDEDAETSLVDIGMRQLNRMDRGRAIDGIRAYNDFKEDIMVYLRTFAESGKVVTKEDIMQFFENKRGEEKKKRNAY